MDQSKKFDQDDLSLLQGIARQAAIGIKNSKLMEVIELETSKRSSLQRFLSPSLVERVMNQELDLKLGGDLRHGTICFSDIIGFTKMSSRMFPEDVVATINRYFNKMVSLIFDYEGMINKFGGDSIMVIWGLTSKGSGLNPHAQAVEASVRMQAAVFDFNFSLLEERQEPIWMGIGLNTGQFVAGNIGSEKQMEYTVIGDEVNLASRIESKAAQGMLYLSESTYAEVQDSVRAVKMQPTFMKGVPVPIVMYSVRGVRPIEASGAGAPRDLYLSIPVSVNQADKALKGFLPRCRIDRAAVTFDLHLNEPLARDEVLGLSPQLQELPDLPPLEVRVVETTEMLSDQTRFFETKVELVKENSFITRFLFDNETIVSSVEPDTIPRQ